MTRLRNGWLGCVFGLIWAWATAVALGEVLSPLPPGAFSIVVIPDTQAYLGSGTKAEPESRAPVTNAVLAAHTKWILGNLEKQQIVFVSHVGDPFRLWPLLAPRVPLCSQPETDPDLDRRFAQRGPLRRDQACPLSRGASVHDPS